MKIRLTVVRMGGGYKKIIFGQSRDLETGELFPDAIIGKDDEELIARLRTRLPAYKNQLRRML